MCANTNSLGIPLEEELLAFDYMSLNIVFQRLIFVLTANLSKTKEMTFFYVHGNLQKGNKIGLVDIGCFAYFRRVLKSFITAAF